MPKKVWKSEDEILKKIDAAKRLAKRKASIVEDQTEIAKALSIEAQEFDDAGDVAKAANARVECGKALEKKAEAEKLYKRAIERTLPRLGEILSAFRTATIPGVMGDYKGVVVK